MTITEPAEPTPLVDVSDMPLADLLTNDAADDTPLGHAIRHVTTPASDKPDTAVSKFNSAS